MVPELIQVLGSQPAGDVSHKPGGRLPLLSARPAVTPTTLNRVATNFAAWWTEARWVWTVCLGLLPDSVATAIWTRALLRLSPARYPLGYRVTLGTITFLFIFNASCQTNYLKIYRSDRRQIIIVGVVWLCIKSETSFSIPRWTLPWKPIFVESKARKWLMK